MAFIGFDTSNYTTSVAIWEEGEIIESRKLLPVPKGTLGLRQSDAVFSHVKALSALVAEITKTGITINGVGASTRPREQEGSYMPCFMVGQMVGEILASVCGTPFYPLAHQSGHIAAALYGAKRLDLVDKKFISLHISGGTTECVLVENLLGGKFKIISETLDLNAGQLVDRIGGMLDIEFPAGKELDKLAQRSTRTFKLKPTFKGNNPCISGAENMAKKMLSEGESPEDIAAFTIAFISAIVERMANDAIKETGVNTVLFAGGVMSNHIISQKLGKKKNFIFTEPKCSSDNAMGIALLSAMQGGERSGDSC